MARTLAASRRDSRLHRCPVGWRISPSWRSMRWLGLRDLPYIGRTTARKQPDNRDQIERRESPMERSICVTCGTQYPASDTPPVHCPICEDDRQYVNLEGQQWTTLAALQGSHANTFSAIAPGITTISTTPTVGIG